jgi:glycosyltransferase involved in cell wall biosynthesis
MYSGNHSPIHPLGTVIEAARKLGAGSEGDRRWEIGDRGSKKDGANIKFLFVGGGTGWEEIKRIKERENLTNVICLPYQSLEKVGASLGAADLHIVAMGEAFVGLVHPCKVYNLLSLGLPWVGIGPKDCHLADLLGELGRDSGCEMLGGDDSAALAKLILERQRSPKVSREKLRAVGRNYQESALAPKLAKIIVEAAKARRD